MPVILSICAVLLFGCGRAGPTSAFTTSTSTTPTSAAVYPSDSTTSAKSSSRPAQPIGKSSSDSSLSSDMSLLTEPQAGVMPWLNLVSHAHKEILVNEYLLTYSVLTEALIAASQRGVTVDVIVDGHPYKDSSALSQSKSAFAGTKVDLRTAPPRFEGSYSFDHAKYFVVDPGQSDQVAILGSPNGTASAFDGYNAEDAIQTTNPSIVAALARLFAADWQGSRAGSSPRRLLVVSPGSNTLLTNLLYSKGPIEVATEELGDAPSLYGAIESHGSQARVLLPSYLSYSERSYALELLGSGVQVRTLSSPYLHAKLIVTTTGTFVGSQNFSEPSLNNNREVGVITSSPQVQSQALLWFNTLWNDGTVLGAQVTTTTATPPTSTTGVTQATTNTASISPPPAPTTGGSYPYIPYGDTGQQVESLWGQPTSIGATTYDGYQEQMWSYPGGTVYFGSSGTVVYVQRLSS